MSALRVPVGLDDHVAGPLDAPITLVEYGDFQCPFCGRAYWEVKELQEALGSRLCFVFRNFPLTQVHPYALQAAEAAESAGAQGRYWEMHDVLFEHQRDLSRPALVAYAEGVGLDLRRFEQDLDGFRYQDRIRRDFLGGVRSGVNGTPTFFLNGELYRGANTFEGLLAAIEGRPAPTAY